jgi:tRNA A-37 threonylcarbamoyl transferase component Bud32
MTAINSRGEDMQADESGRIGPYEVVRKIAQGGMAVVYLARQPGLDRRVALKELAAFPADEPELAARFVHEARVAGSLTHPHIVTTHDFFVHGHRPYIAMEYLERGTLRQYVGGLSLAQVAGVLEGVLAALSHAALRDIVHRDIKPENVLATSGGGVKLADFGIAKALNSLATASFHTKTNTTVGTPAYMAPEQALRGEASHRSDLYSVGVMAYELLTGVLPFGTPSDTPMGILLGHVQGEFVPADVVVPSVDRRVAAWIERLMAREPGARPESPQHAWQELEDAVVAILGPFWRRDALLPSGERELAASARPVARTEATRVATRTTHEPVAEVHATVVKPPTVRPHRRGKGLALAGAAVVGVGAVAAAGAASMGSPAAPVLDVRPIERAIFDQVAFQQRPQDVRCPADVPRRAGTRFACEVMLPGRQRLVAIVRQRDGNGSPDVQLRLG